MHRWQSPDPGTQLMLAVHVKARSLACSLRSLVLMPAASLSRQTAAYAGTGPEIT
jgi:hypothetical protein